MVQKSFHFLVFYLVFYQPSVQIIVDFLRIYREIFSIFVIMIRNRKIFKK